MKELINYLVFGVLTTAVNIVSFWVVESTLNIDYKIATSVAWLLSVVFAYITNKRYVFNSRSTDFRSVVSELGSFFFFRLLSYILDLFVMILFVEIFIIDVLAAKIMANVLVVIFNYIASKYVIFSKVQKTS